MFERFTEKARRVVFFARYEASQFGSSDINTEHVLLGLVREDGSFRSWFSPSLDLASLRKQIESQMTVREKISTSIDLPLSDDSKRVLVYASEEAKALQHDVIDCGHLVLGLLRIKDCAAATLLQQHGMDYESYREVVCAKASARPQEPYGAQQKRPAERPSAWHAAEEDTEPAAASLHPSISALKELLDQAGKHLDIYSEVYGQRRLKRKPWSRKEALGHLIDLAAAHHLWFARALVEPKLTALEYPQDEWVRAQQYQTLSWPDVVDSWVCLNRLLIHVLALIPEEKTQMLCRIGIDEPIALLKLIERYIERCQDLMAQIVSRL